VIHESVTRVLNRCFPPSIDLPSGADIFVDAQHETNFKFLEKLARELECCDINSPEFDFSKEFIRKIRASVPPESRSEFITWFFARYLSDPRVYSYLYGIDRPLAETDRKLEESNLKKLLPKINSLGN